MSPEFEKLLKLAYSDGILTDNEKSLLLKKAEQLGMDEIEAELIISNYSSDENNDVTPTDNYDISNEENLEISTRDQKEVNSIAELEQYLQALQSKATPSWQSALDAQIQVLTYVGSTELIGTTLDSLFKSIKTAKNLAKDENEQMQIMERGSIFIQNFVFFMHAKLAYAVDQNRKKGLELQKKATKVLMKSVANSASAAAAGPAGMALSFSDKFVNEIVDSNIIDGIFDYFNRKSENIRKETQFFESLALLFDKLDRHNSTIGSCDVIAGLIRNYTQKVTAYQNKEKKELLQTKLSQAKKNKNRMWASTVIATGISLVVYLIRWTWHGFIKAEELVEQLVTNETEVATHVDTISWTGWHFIITIIAVIPISLYHYIHYRKELNASVEIQNSLDNLSEQLLIEHEAIATKYDE